jgi:hypothetical protein
LKVGSSQLFNASAWKKSRSASALPIDSCSLHRQIPESAQEIECAWHIVGAIAHISEILRSWADALEIHCWNGEHLGDIVGPEVTGYAQTTTPGYAYEEAPQYRSARNLSAARRRPEANSL